MTALLYMLVFGAVHFEPAHIIGLRVGDVNPLSGETGANFLSGDIDGDNQTDLVLPDRVYFQRNGKFPNNETAALPRLTASPAADLWQGVLYLRLRNRLEAYRWENGEWLTVLGHEVAWPDDATGQDEEPLQGVSSSGVRFGRFLHDLNDDGLPEIMVASPKGIHTFLQQGGAYSQAGILDVLPPSRPIETGQTALWPPSERCLDIPTRQLACQLYFADSAVTVLHRVQHGQSEIAYEIAEYSLHFNEQQAVHAELENKKRTMPLPPYTRPCRLNDDQQMDFAGGNFSLSGAHAFPTPLFETAVTLDGGESFTSIRTQTFRPRCSFVDINGDGLSDMITEQTGILDGGIRETLARLLTRRLVNHELQIRYQDEKNGFSRSPDVQRRVRLRLNQAPYRGSQLFMYYKAGGVVDVTGDFDGNGFRDLAVREDLEDLSIYLNGPGGFSKQPDTVLGLEERWQFAVTDVDNDGASDIVVWWPTGEPASALEDSRVYFSRPIED